MSNPIPAIVTRHLHKCYRDLVAVDDLNLTVATGECFGLLGPNGAGKSTAVRMLYGLTPITSGEVEVLGLNVTRFPRQVKSQIGVVPQEEGLDEELTAGQNLEVYARYFPLTSRSALKQRLQELLAFAGLEDKAVARVTELSGGMKRRLALARALVNDPRLVILDEPTTGLDPQARQLVWQKLRQLQERGVTLLLTTHYMEEAAYLCNRLAIMDQGRVVAAGPPAELVATHIGPQVLEVGIRDGKETAVIAYLAPRARDYRKIGDTVFFYLDDPEPTLAALATLRASLRYHLLRSATLEDVFLKLTGKEFAG